MQLRREIYLLMWLVLWLEKPGPKVTTVSRFLENLPVYSRRGSQHVLNFHHLQKSYIIICTISYLVEFLENFGKHILRLYKNNNICYCASARSVYRQMHLIIAKFYSCTCSDHISHDFWEGSPVCSRLLFTYGFIPDKWRARNQVIAFVWRSLHNWKQVGHHPRQLYTHDC